MILLKVFENRMLKRIFGLMGIEVTKLTQLERRGSYTR
jgi:hypothetical protein